MDTLFENILMEVVWILILITSIILNLIEGIVVGVLMILITPILYVIGELIRNKKKDKES